VFMTNPKNLFGLLLFAAILTVTPAHAESASTFGTGVIQCFHPDAQLAGITFSRGSATPNGRQTWKGWIKFREGTRGEAMMSFVMDTLTKDGEIFARVTPLTDSGSSPPSSSCYLREWQRAYY
jgi:hypothetical protein